jgi:ABC-type multidrug transport system fused ATPase/permease subunit
MLRLPHPDAGVPDLRSRARFLLWMVRRQRPQIALGMLYGVIGTVAQALAPAALGRAIDAGIAHSDTGALLDWTGVLLLLAATNAFGGVMRHRYAVTNFLAGAVRIQQLVVRQAGRLGATLPKRMAAGEIAAIGASDVRHIANALDITARAAGALVSFLVVAVILVRSSLVLGLVVLLGVPLLLTAIGPLLAPLHRRQSRQRELVSQASSLATDTVHGLRVLRGIGGEEQFIARYREASQRVRRGGVRVSEVESWLDALEVLLPGIFLVFVTWLGAHLAARGEITVGQLVSCYGYAAFLVLPLRTATETADKFIRATVASGRVIAMLSLDPEFGDPATPVPAPAFGAELVDTETGLRVTPAQLTAVVCDESGLSGNLADRLGRYVDAPVEFGGVALADLPLATVRERIVVHDHDPRLFSGPLGEELGTGAVAEALRVAAAEDVVAALPDGLDTEVSERGRSFSGGQRQRLALARVLLADPEVLVLDEPTSAVDAHTEAAIADRLRAARAGRTTVVFTTSPLLLDRADRVVFVAGGTVAAEGRHHALLAQNARYRATVTREEAE